MTEVFRKFARYSADLVGSPWSFLAGAGLVFLWACTGKFFSFSDTWQLVINTGTSIGTFLVVFLIQNTQNRDAKVMHMKLDELIRAIQLGEQNSSTWKIGAMKISPLYRRNLNSAAKKRSAIWVD